MPGWAEPVKAVLRAGAHSWLEARERIRPGPSPEAVLLLAHMRSGSTLMAHLLMGHPEVLGYGERNAVIASPRDLHAFAINVYYHRRSFVRRYRYFTDQINHCRLTPDESLLDDHRVHPVLLVREPVASVASMSHVLGRHFGMTQSEGVAYYVERVGALARYARRLGARCVAMTYDQLTQDPATQLARVQRQLGLTSAFLTTYDRFGRRGDAGAHIGAGRIKRSLPQRKITFKAGDRARLDDAYADCCDAFRQTAL